MALQPPMGEPSPLLLTPPPAAASFSPSAQRVPPDLGLRLPHEFSRTHGLLPQRDDAGELVLVCTPGIRCDVVHNALVALAQPLPLAVADGDSLAAAIDAFWEQQHGHDAVDQANAARDQEPIADGDGHSDLEDAIRAVERQVLATAGKAPVVRMLDALLVEAIRAHASDLHLQPLPDYLVVRHRVDGVLMERRRLDRSLVRPLLSRLKVVGRMDVAERLVPQDGRYSLQLGGRSIDVRISTLPTRHGERAVLRLLDASRDLHDFASLGMPPTIAEPFLHAARRNSGIVLVTGPTGSGKTTTLYATLRELDSRERNIMTIEDPVEYELDALGLPISQSQVNTRKGVTFASGLRHILRQDPDVVLVGEIRDAETARVAIQSSLTGHLVFSTLHTNDAISAVTRLIDLGVEPYLVAASLTTVMAQRLVRIRCQTCEGVGCEVCDHSGWRGRNGIYELLHVSTALRELITSGAPLETLRSQALNDGLIPLAEAGRTMVRAGRTTTTELERVIHA